MDWGSELQRIVVVASTQTSLVFSYDSDDHAVHWGLSLVYRNVNELTAPIRRMERSFDEL